MQSTQKDIVSAMNTNIPNMNIKIIKHPNIITMEVCLEESTPSRKEGKKKIYE